MFFFTTRYLSVFYKLGEAFLKFWKSTNMPLEDIAFLTQAEEEWEDDIKSWIDQIPQIS